MTGNNRSLQAELRSRPVGHQSPTTTTRSTHINPVDADSGGPFAEAITARIAAAKRRLLEGGLLREVEWGIADGEPDIRGRKTFTYTPLDAFIEQRPGLDRSAVGTDRSDNTVLTILDPVAIKDTDTFRWGGHVYKIKQIDGIVQDEETGVRFASEVTVIR